MCVNIQGEKRMKDRMICILLTIIILTGFLPARILAAEPIHVLALGDSITTGYALANTETERFTALLGNDYTVTNKAVNGNTVAGIAEQLRNSTVPAQTIAAADVITITIGGNDIMGLLYARIAEAYNAKNHSNLGVTDVSKMISGLNPSNLTQHSSLLHIAEQLLNKENAAYIINTQAFTDALISCSCPYFCYMIMTYTHRWSCWVLFYCTQRCSFPSPYF